MKLRRVQPVQYSFQVCLQGVQKQVIELGPFTEVRGLHMRSGARNELVGFKTEAGNLIQVPVEWFDPSYANQPYFWLAAQKFSKPTLMSLEFTNQTPGMKVVLTGMLSGVIEAYEETER